MSTSTKHKIGGAILVLGGVLASAQAAYAGTKTSAPVVVNLTARTASGSMGSARSSSGSTQSIGCVGVIMPTTPGYAACSAVDSAGNTGLCFVPPGIILEVMSSLGDDSFISFTWDSGGNCTSIEVRNYSDYAPKTP